MDENPYFLVIMAAAAMLGCAFWVVVVQVLA